MGNLNFFFSFPRANPNMLFYFLPSNQNYPVFFFFPSLNGITKNFVKDRQTNCCQKNLFIEKSGFHKAVSVGVAVKSKPSGEGIFKKNFFLRRFFLSSSKDPRCNNKTHGTNRARRTHRRAPEPSHVRRTALPSPPRSSSFPPQLPAAASPGSGLCGARSGGGWRGGGV